MQSLVPSCIVLASRMSLYRVSLYQEFTVLCCVTGAYHAWTDSKQFADCGQNCSTWHGIIP